RVSHENALDQGAVVQPPERLAGRATVAALLPYRPKKRGQQLTREPPAGGDRNVGHRVRIADQPAEVVGGELPGPELLLPQRGHRGPAPGRVEVGEVPGRERGTASGRVNQGQRRHGGPSVPREPVHLTGTNTENRTNAVGAAKRMESSRSISPPWP